MKSHGKTPEMKSHRKTTEHLISVLSHKSVDIMLLQMNNESFIHHPKMCKHRCDFSSRILEASIVLMGTRGMVISSHETSNSGLMGFRSHSI